MLFQDEPLIAELGRTSLQSPLPLDELRHLAMQELSNALKENPAFVTRAIPARPVGLGFTVPTPAQAQVQVQETRPAASRTIVALVLAPLLVIYAYLASAAMRLRAPALVVATTAVITWHGVTVLLNAARGTYVRPQSNKDAFGHLLCSFVAGIVWAVVSRALVLAVLCAGAAYLVRLCW